MWDADEVRFLVLHADEPPTLPERFFAIRKVLADERAGAADLARVIASDQATCAVILKRANAAALRGSAGRCASLPQAIARLGFDEAASIALGISLVHGLLDGIGMARARALWSHAWAVSLLVGHLAKAHGLSRSEREAWLTTGLLHDIGRWMIGIRVDLGYFEGPLGALWGDALIAAEREAFGTDHAEVGALLAEFWQLPPGVSAAIRTHHAPEGPELLLAADRLVHERLPAQMHFEEVPALVAELWKEIGEEGSTPPR